HIIREISFLRIAMSRRRTPLPILSLVWGPLLGIREGFTHWYPAPTRAFLQISQATGGSRLYARTRCLARADPGNVAESSGTFASILLAARVEKYVAGSTITLDLPQASAFQNFRV